MKQEPSNKAHLNRRELLQFVPGALALVAFGDASAHAEKHQDSSYLEGVGLNVARYGYLSQYMSTEHTRYKAFPLFYESEDDASLKELPPFCVIQQPSGDLLIMGDGGTFMSTLAASGVISGDPLPHNIEQFLRFKKTPRGDWALTKTPKQYGGDGYGCKLDINYSEMCKEPLTT